MDSIKDLKTNIPIAVGKTSLFIAAARSIETKKQKKERLFEDPYAELLAGNEGFNLLKQAQLSFPALQETVAFRTYFIDKCLYEWIIEGNIKQLILLGSGMDTRAWRLPFKKNVNVYEIDFEEVLKYKNKLIDSTNRAPLSKAQKIFLQSDLTKEDWINSLKKGGFKSLQESVWVMEGLLMYLKENEVESILKEVFLLSSPGSRILAHIHSSPSTDEFPAASIHSFLEDLGAPIKWSSDYAENLFKKHLFREVKRCSYDSMEGIPEERLKNLPSIRSYFITCLK
jgi:methyltransferase (TIGR00027 family)